MHLAFTWFICRLLTNAVSTREGIYYQKRRKDNFVQGTGKKYWSETAMAYIKVGSESEESQGEPQSGSQMRCEDTI